MAHVRLHRADGQRPHRPRHTQHPAQRGALGRIARLRAGAVRLHVHHFVGRDARPLVHLPQQILLRPRTGQGQPGGAPVAVAA